MQAVLGPQNPWFFIVKDGGTGYSGPCKRGFVDPGPNRFSQELRLLI